ncbi:MAG TPA: BPSS1780 family membrane protein [Usitatibacter sp.]|nr:BPSS1780 family membrane protein [Usitatibacter sp.]
MSATESIASNDEPLDAGLKLVLPGKAESPGDGWTWIAQGWTLFARAPLMWVIAMVILFVVMIAINLVPLLGALAFQVVQVVFVGGLMAACRSLETGGDFDLEHLFAGFKKRFIPLAVVGVLMLLGMLAIMVVWGLFVGFSVLGAFLTGDPEAVMSTVMASMGMILLGTLVVLGLLVPLMAAYWFAPALVMMHGMKPLAAMKASFFACFRNFVPFIVYGLVMLVALIVAMIPFGLGMLVWLPLAITSTYVAYRRIFTEEASAAVTPPTMV